ncbi:hypothetical protein C2869_12285 [Saccharobesus litoralis]|uniref:Uncharacterized protein n=1 Tax=Saccharobesus litoralis TaxID=2172099 RepID=A0A2S0VSH5_9ALTE|nr:hypothetical protein [Saccharobesus litoralis]AWB67165.1 hypothetical protein C2869_12285 [Saccharobesus litoralis]
MTTIIKFAKYAFICMLCFSCSVFAIEITGGSNHIQISNLPQFVDHVLLRGDNNNTLIKSKTGSFSASTPFKDGYYTYQVVVQKPIDFSKLSADQLNNGRDADTRQAMTALVVEKSGTFLVKDGLVLDAKLAEKAR